MPSRRRGEGGRWAVAELSGNVVWIILSEVTSALVQLMPEPERVSISDLSRDQIEMLGLAAPPHYAGRPPVGGLVTDPPTPRPVERFKTSPEER